MDVGRILPAHPVPSPLAALVVSRAFFIYLLTLFYLLLSLYIYYLFYKLCTRELQRPDVWRQALVLAKLGHVIPGFALEA